MAAKLPREALPAELGPKEWSPALASVGWDGNRTWAGHYRTSVERSWTMAVDMRHTVSEGTMLGVGVRCE